MHTLITKTGSTQNRAFLIVWFIFLALLLPGVLPTEEACAQKAEIMNVGVINSEENLLLYFDLIDGFSEEVDKGIHNGISASFNFEVSLNRQVKGQDSSLVSVKEFSRAITYDSLKEEYRVRRSENDNTIVTVKLFSKAKRLVSEVRGFPVISLKSLTPGRRYIIKVRASLDERTLPLKVHYFVPFWKSWNVETDWTSMTFQFEPQDQ